MKYMLMLLVAVTSSCNDSADDTLGEAACGDSSHAVARKISSESELLTGRHAVGKVGDYVLRNDKSAFVIKNVDHDTTYYHYGGIVIDVAAMDGCEQITPDEFEEFDPLIGQLSLTTIEKSVIRAFRAEKVEVINDGADGQAAIIRATGVDDQYWLVAYTLIIMAVENDNPVSLPKEYPIVHELDYILEPGASAIRIVHRLRAKEDIEGNLMTASLLIAGDETVEYSAAKSKEDLGGFGFTNGVPWIGVELSQAAGAYTLALEDGDLGTAAINGVNAIFNFEHIVNSPIRLEAGDEYETKYILSVGERDGASAANNILSVSDTTLSEKLGFATVKGTVQDSVGNPISTAVVQIEQAFRDSWLVRDRVQVDVTGSFDTTWITDIGEDIPAFRLVAVADGYLASDSVELVASTKVANLVLPANGTLGLTVKSGGESSPFRLSINSEDSTYQRQYYLWKDAEVGLPVGTYQYAISRGYEFAMVTGTVEIEAGKNTAISGTLERVVDTAGYMSIDTHVHSGPSADSKVTLANRILGSAAEGLEVPVATDHEAIVGLYQGIVETGLQAYVNTLTGEEVTATLPEHLTMFPVNVQGTVRGDPIKWYGLGLPELFDAMIERGGAINIINHPGQLYELYEWDRINGRPGVDDYAKFELFASKAIWSWNFHAIELGNNIMKPGLKNSEQGAFDNWMSMLNHGHIVAGVVASDVHGVFGVGDERVYFPSSSDKPDELIQDDVVNAYLNASLTTSRGAFIQASIGGSGIGSLAASATSDVAVSVKVQAVPEVDITHIMVFANCDEVTTVAAFDLTADEGEKSVVKYDGDINIQIPTDAHIVVAAFGQDAMPFGFRNYDATSNPRAMTNALLVDRDGNGKFDPPGGKTCVYDLLGP